EEVDQKKKSQAIDRQLEEDSRRLRRECKILLLGSGESGKSTIVKQMKIIHLKGYSEDELYNYRPTVFKNLVECAKAVILAMRQFDLDLSTPENKEYADFLMDYTVESAGLSDLGFRIEDIIEQEHDAALGNGGLGRLAACFLDSLASLNYPAWGYGLRYRYGIFKQEIIDGYQVEVPDYWLDFNPWEFPRHDVIVDIQFYGHVNKSSDENGKSIAHWEGGETVQAVAYDVPIPGYATPSTNNLRLWSSKAASGEFDFQKFNSGDYESS
ncbi:hypothetical protein BN1723_017350, partial [Verticillium longisporum]